MGFEMASAQIVLAGVGAPIEGLQWQSERRLRIGRQSNLEVVLQEPTVAREHAEVSATARGWVLRDLSRGAGTFLNGVPVDEKPRPLQLHDMIHCGRVGLRIAALRVPQLTLPSPRGTAPSIKTTSFLARVQAATQRSWEQGLQGLAGDTDRMPQGNHFFSLVRAGYHLSRVGSLKELLARILDDTASVFSARQAAIWLVDRKTGELAERTVSSIPAPGGSDRPPFSRTLAQRCVSKGESFLCADVEADGEGPQRLAEPPSRRRGATSVLCALLRSPRQRLGVLYLDRGPEQASFTKEDLHLADALAASISTGIECALLIDKHCAPVLHKAAAFVRRAIELRDPRTGEHLDRVQRYVDLLAEQLAARTDLGPSYALHADQREILHTGAWLHDLGKIAVPDTILHKPGRLTEQELTQLREQITKGSALAELLPELAPVVPIIRSHHERWDGKGYPDGLSGEEIPLLARIVAVADAFDSMTADQPYRPRLPLEEALAELQAGAGSQFDPRLVSVFVGLRPELEKLALPPSIRP